MARRRSTVLPFPSFAAFEFAAMLNEAHPDLFVDAPARSVENPLNRLVISRHGEYLGEIRWCGSDNCHPASGVAVKVGRYWLEDWCYDDAGSEIIAAVKRILAG